MSDPKPAKTCGFCRRGAEVLDVCGKLWDDAEKGCTAHQRCMQYSANLCQYQTKRFGGFKVSKVAKEINRGKRLKCCICGTKNKHRKGANGAASAGCAWFKCRKTFHFYCARTSSTAVARKLVETSATGAKLDRYYVFCCDDHKKQFEIKQKNQYRYVSDTDDEMYKTDGSNDGESEESESSDEESGSESPDRDKMKDKPDAKADSKGGQQSSTENKDSSCEKSSDESSKEKISAGDKKVSASSAAVKEVKDEVGSSNLAKRKSTDNGGDVKTKQKKKPESEKSNEDSDYVICFVENTDGVSGVVKEALEQAACSRFNVTADSVYVWQYNAQPLSREHFVYLLNDIGKALATDDPATLNRLVFSIQSSDIETFEEKIRVNAKLDDAARREVYESLRRQIAHNFKAATEKNKSTRRVCSYCRIRSDNYSEPVAFVLITKEVMDVGLAACHVVSSSDTKDDSSTDSASDKHSRGTREVRKSNSKKTDDRKSEKSLAVRNETQFENTREAGDGDDDDENSHRTTDDERKSMDVSKDRAVGLGTTGDRTTVDAKRFQGCFDDVFLADDIKVEPGLVVGTIRRAVAELDGGRRETDGPVETRAEGPLFHWNSNQTLLRSSVQTAASHKLTVHESELKNCILYLNSRIDCTTVMQRYPMLQDVDVLSAKSSSSQLSVVDRLIERYFETAGCEGKNRTRNSLRGASPKVMNSSTAWVTASMERKPGSLSHFVCIGPVDAAVIDYSQYVKRRVAAVLDNWTEGAGGGGEVCCAVDVGSGVGLTTVGDVVAEACLPPRVTFSAFTAVDPRVFPATVALIVFRSAVAK